MVNPMIDTLYKIYAVLALAAACALSAGALFAALRERRRRGHDAMLRAKYLHALMLALSGGERRMPYFPLFGHPGTRLLLCETIAGLVSITYGLDTALLRHAIDRYGLDRWMLRHVRRCRGYRRARALALLACLPSDETMAAAVAPYLRSRNRYVRFYALTVQLAADPAHALRYIESFRRWPN